MAGTKAGGKKAAAKNRELYGADFYAKIGAKGGKLGNTGGFAANRELAKQAGRIGGLKSRRGKAKVAQATQVVETTAVVDETVDNASQAA